VAVMVWNYHDDDLRLRRQMSSSASRAANGKPALTHHRIDRDHSNAYEVWKKMGSPQKPTPQQYAELEKAGQLQTLGTA